MRATAGSNRCRRACSSGSASPRRWSAAAAAAPRRAHECARPGRPPHRAELLEELRGRGISVLLNSHLLSEIELVCDRVAILLHGRLVTEGSPAELARARGVEIETDEGVAPLRGRPRGRAAPRGRAGCRRAKSLRRPVLTSTLEDTYLEAVGGESS